MGEIIGFPGIRIGDVNMPDSDAMRARHEIIGQVLGGDALTNFNRETELRQKMEGIVPIIGDAPRPSDEAFKDFNEVDSVARTYQPGRVYDLFWGSERPPRI